MSTFSDEHARYEWNAVAQRIAEKSLADVDRALAKTTTLDLDDFAALVSPAAVPRLEAMARKSRELTLKRFGKTQQMYLPLYLSNECTNSCTYCGFSHENDIPRRTLTIPEILQEIHVIKRQWDFEHILLVTGEDVRHADVAYLKEAVKICRQYFAHVSIEVQPLETHEYAELAEAGVSAVMVYQETYNKAAYPGYHPKGKKRIFDYRLQCPDRIGLAGIRKVGIGCLIGLEDWRTDCFFTAMHLRYLEKAYWKMRYSISFPRLRPHAGLQDQKNYQTERELVQLICAYRIFDPDVEISLSTRESAYFRDHTMNLGVTTLSAGSRTDPGGYSISQHELEQFAINDDRTPQDVVDSVRKNGYEPVWKDWDPVLDAV
jgi:2-iminoacetate synthase